ncbi:hypothetical protein ACLESD_28300 [Pyxidicoccus sp. 3LFB2]
MHGLRRWGAAGLLAAALVLGAVACDGGGAEEDVGTRVGEDPEPLPPEDRPGAPDSGTGTGGAVDGGAADGGSGVGGAVDGGAADSGSGAGGAVDGGGFGDGGPADGGAEYGGVIDGGMPDAGMGGGGGAASADFVRTIGAPGLDLGHSVAIAGDGDVLVASSHRVSLPDFGEGRQPEAGNVALSRFNPKGTHLWTYAEVHEGNCGEGGPCTLTFLTTTATAVDLAGRSALATLYYEEGPFGPFLLRETPRITVLDRNGKVLWKRVIQGTGGKASVDDLGFDSSGNLYAGGFISGPGWDFGDGQPRGLEFLPASFVASYAPDGALRWVKVFGDARGSSRYGVMTVEPSGGLVLTGEMTGRLSFGGEELVGNEDGRLPDSQTYVEPRAFVARFGPEGVHRWSRLLSPGRLHVNDLAVGPAGVALAGYFEEFLTFAGRTIPAPYTEGGAQDGFVAVMATEDGQERWALSVRSGLDDQMFGVGWTPGGDVWAAGAVWGNASVASTRLPDTEEDGPRFVLTRLRGATGEVVSATSPASGVPDSGDLTVDSRGVVTMTGGTVGGTNCDEGCGGPIELYLRQWLP